MKLWLKTIIFAVVLILGCVLSFYVPDNVGVVLLLEFVFTYVLIQS